MTVETIASPTYWVAFAIVVAVMLALDLGVFHRRAHVSSLSEALVWSGIWVALSLAFNVFVAVRFGRRYGGEFFTGYLLEKSMSVDNLFVFYMVFSSFRVPADCQHRVLFWGILGAIALRTIMVFGGIALLARFSWIVYVFGAVLIGGGIRMFRRHADETPVNYADKRMHRVVAKVLPTSETLDGPRLFTRRDGRFMFTPLFPVLVMLELTDVVFAADSILAIFAVTVDPFIVLTSNILAILGLRSLYFVLAGVARKFDYLQPGLACVLIFVGGKLALSHVIHVPILASLAVIVILIGGSIIASIIKARREPRGGASAGASPDRVDAFG